MAKGSTWGANPTPPAASSTKCCSTKEASSAAMETLETPWFPKGNDREMMGFHGLSMSILMIQRLVACPSLGTVVEL